MAGIGRHLSGLTQTLPIIQLVTKQPFSPNKSKMSTPDAIRIEDLERENALLKMHARDLVVATFREDMQLPKIGDSIGAFYSQSGWQNVDCANENELFALIKAIE